MFMTILSIQISQEHCDSTVMYSTSPRSCEPAALESFNTLVKMALHETKMMSGGVEHEKKKLRLLDMS
jgi:hypothetical protein